MKKKVLSSVIVICSLEVLIGGGTFASFQDVETSTGNTFTDGTLDLKLADSDETFRDGVTATWTMTNMIPGMTSTNTHSPMLMEMVFSTWTTLLYHLTLEKEDTWIIFQPHLHKEQLLQPSRYS